MLQEQTGLSLHKDIFDQLHSISKGYLESETLVFPDAYIDRKNRCRKVQLPPVYGDIQRACASSMIAHIGLHRDTKAAHFAKLLDIDNFNIDHANIDRLRPRDQGDDESRELTSAIALDNQVLSAREVLKDLVFNGGFDAAQYIKESNLAPIIQYLVRKGRTPKGRSIFSFDRMSHYMNTRMNDGQMRQSYALSCYLLGMTLLDKGVYYAGVKYGLTEAFEKAPEINYGQYDNGYMQHAFKDRGWKQLSKQSFQALSRYVAKRTKKAETSVSYASRIQQAEDIKQLIVDINSGKLPYGQRFKVFRDQVLPNLIVLAATKIFAAQRAALRRKRYAGNLPKAVKEILDIAISQFGLTDKHMKRAADKTFDIIKRSQDDLLSDKDDLTLAKDSCVNYVRKMLLSETKKMRKNEPMLERTFKYSVWMQNFNRIRAASLSEANAGEELFTDDYSSDEGGSGEDAYAISSDVSSYIDDDNSSDKTSDSLEVHEDHSAALSAASSPYQDQVIMDWQDLPPANLEIPDDFAAPAALANESLTVSSATLPAPVTDLGFEGSEPALVNAGIFAVKPEGFLPKDALSILVRDTEKKIIPPNTVRLIFRDKSMAEDCQKQLHTKLSPGASAAAAQYDIENIVTGNEQTNSGAAGAVEAIIDCYAIRLVKGEYNQIMGKSTAYDDLCEAARCERQLGG